AAEDRHLPDPADDLRAHRAAQDDRRVHHDVLRHADQHRLRGVGDRPQAARGRLRLRRHRPGPLPLRGAAGALPFVFSRLRTATGTAFVVITAVEFTGATTEGLGYLIWNSWQLFMPEKLYVGLVVIGIIGALLTWILTTSEKLIL